VVHCNQSCISHRYLDIMRHLLDKHIPIVFPLDAILGSFLLLFGGALKLWVVPFFGNVPLAAAEGSRVRY